MVDLHNRVEARTNLRNTGVHSDNEHIEDLRAQWDLNARAWEKKGKKRFGEVLAETPVPPEEAEETEAQEAEDKPRSKAPPSGWVKV